MCIRDRSTISRNTQGVKAISLNEGDVVTAIATVEAEENVVKDTETVSE